MNRNVTLHSSIKSILLVEDDLDDQDFIKEALLNLDNSLSIQTITSGTKVLPYLETLAANDLPQLMILDYNLPELDGAEVLNKLQKNSRYEAIAKIVWSTSSAPQYQVRCLSLGAACYLVKPSTISGIEDMARQMLYGCMDVA